MITITPTSLPYRRLLQTIRTTLTSTYLDLQQHTYTILDLQYVFLLALFSFCCYLIDQPVWFKSSVALLVLLFLIFQTTRSFILPFLAIASWLTLFYSCRFIPSEWRPHIYTSVLPALDNIIYGGNLSNLLASSTTPWKDLLAWLPYGIFHFVMPIVVAIWITMFAPVGTLPVFARTFGYMNVAGVLTQLLFPCAPPWYEMRYEPLQPAMYSMPGDPGGLTRVDDILGTNMYRSTFTASPLVFGAFPSLHSGCAWQLAFFTVFVFGPRSIPLALFYVFWIWWAAMYLGHHYVIDLVGGGIYAVVAFWIGSSFLPSVMSNDGINDFVLEKQVLLQRSPHTLTSERKEWKQMQEDSDDDTTEGSIDTIVVQMETAADANSIANTMSVMNRSYESPVSQSWNGWQGYGNWLVILSSMKSGKRVPRTSPNVSPRSQLKPALHFSPAGESTMILPNQSSYTIDDIDLETICVENDVAECAGLSLSNLASPPLSTLSIPSVAGDIQSTTAASITIAATMGTSADDSDKRSIRPAHLSIPNSPSATPAPTSLLKSTFLDPEFGTPGLNTVGSGLGLGLTGSISSALLVSTAGTSSASVNVGSKRLKDD